MSNLQRAKSDFLAEVGRYVPDVVKGFERVLDDLVLWSEQHKPDIEFVWHEGNDGRVRQMLVKYCVPGIPSPFWAAWPRAKDGAKLSLLTDANAFPEELREAARAGLATIGKEDVFEVPEVSFGSLIPQVRRDQLKALMERLLKDLVRRGV